MARVALIDSTGCDIITEGVVEDHLIEDASSIVRGDLHFRYVGMRRGGILTFQEVNPPLVITEF